LTHLAYGSFKVSDPSKLLACLVEQFGGGINFVCSDYAQMMNIIFQLMKTVGKSTRVLESTATWQLSK